MVSFPEFHRPVRNTIVGSAVTARPELQLTNEPLLISRRVASSESSHDFAVWFFNSCSPQ